MHSLLRPYKEDAANGTSHAIPECFKDLNCRKEGKSSNSTTVFELGYYPKEDKKVYGYVALKRGKSTDNQHSFRFEFSTEKKEIKWFGGLDPQIWLKSAGWDGNPNLRKGLAEWKAWLAHCALSAVPADRQHVEITSKKDKGKMVAKTTKDHPELAAPSQLSGNKAYKRKRSPGPQPGGHHNREGKRSSRSHNGGHIEPKPEAQQRTIQCSPSLNASHIEQGSYQQSPLHVASRIKPGANVTEATVDHQVGADVNTAKPNFRNTPGFYGMSLDLSTEGAKQELQEAGEYGDRNGLYNLLSNPVPQALKTKLWKHLKEAHKELKGLRQ